MNTIVKKAAGYIFILFAIPVYYLAVILAYFAGSIVDYFADWVE